MAFHRDIAVHGNTFAWHIGSAESDVAYQSMQKKVRIIGVGDYEFPTPRGDHVPGHDFSARAIARLLACIFDSVLGS